MEDSYVVKAKNIAGLGSRATGVMHVGGPRGSGSSPFPPAASESAPLSSLTPSAPVAGRSTFDVTADNIAGAGREARGFMHVDQTGEVLNEQEEQQQANEAVLLNQPQQERGNFT